MNVLELYSGIGGMHTAFKMSQKDGRIVCAVDINEIANEVYAHNFPYTHLIKGNIEALTAEKINNMCINTILMSPPCQPFTRNGVRKDMQDPRTKSFKHLLHILADLNISQLLLENVKGFEQSEMHLQFLSALTLCGFHHKEFMLSPHEFGVPNSRTRYYCIAKKEPFDNQQLTQISHIKSEPLFALETILENVTSLDYSIPMKDLAKRYQLLDIVYGCSKRSCCFTKSYGRYMEGTGSVITPKDQTAVEKVYDKLAVLQHAEEEDTQMKEELLRSLELRFFTPREICRLMCFPEEFTFPLNVSNRQQYMLLGNSINCKVVSELIKLL